MMKYILIVFTFLACQDSIFPENVPPPVSNEVLDTIKTLPGKIVAQPVLFETAFIKGTTQTINNKTLYLYGVTIGKIKIRSGHIIACDPLHVDENGKPFTQIFPTGEFPVQLSIAKLNNEESTAFARINFSNEPVEKWEFALLKGQKPIPLGGEEKYGYGVDAGKGIFIDEEAGKALLKNTVDSTFGLISQAMDKHYHKRWKYAMYDFGNYNLAAFTTNFGDGYYATYIGFDANGRPCRLLSDFGLFDWNQSKKQ